MWLDITARGGAFIKERFPRIYETCLSLGLDLGREPAPVHPAAHYAMGGVTTDLEGRTTIKGLYAAGEVACTGVHGANRLASNSLLEGLVFGARAGRAMRNETGMARIKKPQFTVPNLSAAELREVAWNYCGILRNQQGLETAIRILDSARRREVASADLPAIELRNIYDVIGLIARSALARKESRGAHYRTDAPE